MVQSVHIKFIVLQLILVLGKVAVSALKIPVLFDSSNAKHRNIYYHPEQPARIDHCVKKLANQAGVQLIDISPSEATTDDAINRNVSRQPFSDEELQYARSILLKTHSADLVTNLENRCRESRQRRIEEGRDPLGFVGNIDEDTFVTTETFDICLRATAAWIRTIDSAMHHSNQLRTAMALTRPPGHHATYETANGFCLFNFAAAAAIHAMESNPELKISIFDWDVHYGQGVAMILQNYPRARYVSIHQSPAFPYQGAKFVVTGNHSNVLTIPIIADTTWSSGYREKFESHALPFIMSDDWRPDIVLICAGYDALDSDELASVGLVARDYGEMIDMLSSHLKKKVDGSSDIPIALGLEGGYQLSDMAGGGNLADAVVATLQALADR
jgi:acetoin utilization deacetylase AcuC-like enzyme